MRKHIFEQVLIFLSVSKWLILSSIIGIFIGALMTLFLNILHYAENSRDFLNFPYYYTLPFALVFSVWIIQTFAKDAAGHGTEKVIEAIHKRDGDIDIKVLPVKLIATLVTIFSGGSVGKEGPGAQIGASFASFVANFFKFSPKDRKKIVICGISAGFASVFGTPIAGAIFGIEVLIIGIIMYDVLLPSLIAGFAAFTTAQFLGIQYTYFDIHFYKSLELDLTIIGQVIVAGIFFGLVSDMLVTTLKKTDNFVKRLTISKYSVAFFGGVLLVVLSLIFSDRYFGLGVGIIENALNPWKYITVDFHWYDFIMKIVFTSITLAIGGSGGIVTPIFFVGATSGLFFGNIIGDNISFFAALGFVSVLAGTTNTPIAAIIMSVELFGVEIANYAAISAIITFLITGHRSVYPSQKLSFKKAEDIDIDEGSDLEHTTINIDTKKIEKLNIIKKQLRRRSFKWSMIDPRKYKKDR